MDTLSTITGNMVSDASIVPPQEAIDALHEAEIQAKRAAWKVSLWRMNEQHAKKGAGG